MTRDILLTWALPYTVNQSTINIIFGVSTFDAITMCWAYYSITPVTEDTTTRYFLHVCHRENMQISIRNVCYYIQVQLIDTFLFLLL